MGYNNRKKGKSDLSKHRIGNQMDVDDDDDETLPTTLIRIDLKLIFPFFSRMMLNGKFVNDECM